MVFFYQVVYNTGLTQVILLCQVEPPQVEDENSFDPSEFFRHSTLADQAAAEEQKQAEEDPMDTDLHDDLQVCPVWSIVKLVCLENFRKLSEYM